MTSPHKPEQAGSGAEAQIREGYQRWLNLEQRKADVASDLRELFAELKGEGYDTKAMRASFRVVRDLDDALAQSAISEHDALVDIYVAALTRDARDAREDGGFPHTISFTSSEGRRTASESQSEQGTDTGSHPIQESVPGPGATSDVVTPSSDESVTSREAVPPALPATVHGSRPDGSGGASPSPVGPFTSSAGHGGDASPATVQPETATKSTERPIAAAEVANTHGQTGTADVRARSHVPANAEAEAEKVGQSEQKASIEPPVDTNSVAVDLEPAAGAQPAAVPPGVVTWEKTHAAPVGRHPINKCWPEQWGVTRTLLLGAIKETGVGKPIVMIGDEVLDGWGRYTIARELLIEYPVVQYAGDDPLADSIRWNLEKGARMMTLGERKGIALKLAKLPEYAHRASEIAELFGLEERTAA